MLSEEVRKGASDGFREALHRRCWVASRSEKWIEVENPADQNMIARVPAGCEENVSRAVRAAVEVFHA